MLLGLLRLLPIAAAFSALLAGAAPADAQLLGLEYYLPQPKVEFSADFTVTSDGDTVAGKMMRSHDKERREVVAEGNREVMIIRGDRGIVWSLSPDDKLYLETSLDEALGRIPDADGKAPEPQITVTPLGQESIDGVPVTKRRVSGKDADGSPVEATVWTSEDGVVMRLDSVVVDDDGARHAIRLELHHLRVAPQDPGLFEIPAGYRRIMEGPGSKLGALPTGIALARRQGRRGLGFLMDTLRSVENPSPALAAPPRLKRKASSLGLAWRLHKNAVGAWSDDDYREEFFARRLLFRKVFVANSPAAAKHVLLDRAENYVKSFIARQLLKPLGQGLLNTEGAVWRHQRRTMAPAFHPRRVEAFVPAMAQATRDMLSSWEEHPPGVAIDIAEEMAQLTLDIITRTMFSSDLRDRAGEVRTALLRYQRFGGRPSIADLLGLPPWIPRLHAREVRDATATLDEIIYEIIAERRRDGGPADDLLGLLLAARDEETGEGMDDAELRDQIATIFTAGHETTANALTWTWYLLSQHPWADERLCSELAHRLCGRAPTVGDLPHLTYARMVLEESMRLYPPAHTMSRQALEDDEIAGHKIPKGAAVLVSPWLLHRHEKLWTQPKLFDPERFAPSRAETRPRYAYLPFGGGPRICIGASFAMQEAIIILAMVAQRYRLRLQPGHGIEPIGLITLRPRDGLPMVLERRSA